MKSKIDWRRGRDNEWYFVGAAEEFRTELVQEFLSGFFDGPEIYLVIDRHNSVAVEVADAVIRVQKHLTQMDVTLCDKSFTRMIEFNKAGVAKHGTIDKEF